MGGPSQQSIQGQTAAAQQQNQISQEELGLEKGFLDLANQQINKGNALQQPAINFYSALAGGNTNAAMAATAPEIGQEANAAKQATANIMNTVPAGAGRDYALAQVPRQESTDISSFINQAFLQAPNALAQLGTQAQGLGVQEQGAGLSAIGGASSATGSAANIYGNVANQQAQGKATTLGFLGQLAGAGAGAFTGGGFGGFGGGGSGGGNTNAIPSSAPINTSGGSYTGWNPFPV